MSITIGPPSADELRPRITVIGVGGAGGNAIANMIRADIEGVDFIVANTDAQALNTSIAEHRIQLGPEITRGLGAGSRPEVGRAAAEETVQEIEQALEGMNMVFIAAGMGGGTGTGAAPVIAEIAREKGILTVGVVTKPFLFEGTRRMRSAESGIEELQKHVDTLLVIPNQNLFLVAKAETTFKEAFMLADEVLQQGVRSITDLMVMPGLINLDFADVRSVMGEMGKAMMGTGEGEGANRALEAAEKAIANPLLDGVSMKGAKGVIISIIGGEDMRLMEVDEAANHIRELVDPEANIIWGSAFNPELEGRIRVSVVATGIEASATQGRPAAAQAGHGAGLSTARGPRRPAVGLAAARASGGETDSGAAAAPAPFGRGARFGVAARNEPEAREEPAADETPPERPAERSFEAAAPASRADDRGGRTPQPWANDDEDIAPAASNEEDALELTVEAAEEAQSAPEPERALEPRAESVRPTRQDELLLSEDEPAPARGTGEPRRTRMLANGGARGAQPGAAAGAASGAAAKPATQPRNPARSGAAPRVGGGSLFERFSRQAEDEPEEQEEPARGTQNAPQGGSGLRIPRFLNRQGNQ